MSYTKTTNYDYFGSSLGHKKRQCWTLQNCRVGCLPPSPNTLDDADLSWPADPRRIILSRQSASAMSSASVELTPLDCTVRVATLDPSRLHEAFHVLLKLLFFHEDEDEDEEQQRFFSISVSSSEKAAAVPEPDAISIIADAEELALFDALRRDGLPDALRQDETDWRVLMVSEGAAGFDSVGVVERITGPLASAAIPVLYTSTVSTDFVLIPVEKVDEAVEALNGGSPRPMGKARNTDRSSSNHDKEQQLHAANGRPPAAATPERNGELQSPQRHEHPLHALSATSQIFSIDKASRRAHTSALLRLLFLPHPDDPPHALRALTETPDEVSILCGTVPWFLDYAESNSIRAAGLDGWVPIRVGGEGGTPLDEVGVVATQANVLARANIPIVYHASFLSDYTLVQEHQLQRAIDAFTAAGFTIT